MADNDHKTIACEHGRQISTCRCPSDNKTIVVTAHCPFGCERAGSKLSSLELYSVKAFAQTEAMAALPEAVRHALQQVVREDMEAKEAHLAAKEAERLASGVIDLGAPVLIGYNPYFAGLMGTVVGGREETPDSSGQRRFSYRVRITNGEEHVYAFIGRGQEDAPEHTYIFPGDTLTPLPRATDITVKRIDPPTC